MPSGSRSYIASGNPANVSAGIRNWWDGFEVSSKRLYEDRLPEHFFVKFKLISPNILGGVCHLTIRVSDAPSEARPKFTRHILLEVSTGELMGESSAKVLDICAEGIRKELRESGMLMRKWKRGFPHSLLER